jgi:hypothetical protein
LSSGLVQLAATPRQSALNRVAAMFVLNWVGWNKDFLPENERDLGSEIGT